MKPKLKPPGTKRLKLKCVILLSTSAFKFKLRRYIKEFSGKGNTSQFGGDFVVPSYRGSSFLDPKVGAVQVDPIKPMLKAPETTNLSA